MADSSSSSSGSSTGFGNVLAGIGVGSSILNLAGGAFGAYKNYQLQKQNLAYQKAVQQEEWRREDNAVQRRVADLSAAGLSPTLAAGSAAQAGPVVNTAPPRVDVPQIPDVAAQYMALLRGQADISQTQSQTELTKLLQGKAIADTKDAQASAALKAVDAAIKSRDLKLSQDAGVSTNGTTWLGKYIRDIQGFFMNQTRPDTTTPTKSEKLREMNKKNPGFVGTRG